MEENSFVYFFGKGFFIVLITIYFVFSYMILTDVLRIYNIWIRRIVSIILGFFISIALAYLMKYLFIKILTFLILLF